MDKEKWVKSIKITLGVVLGVMLAKWLRMDFEITVATIVIVSMLTDKRQSLKQSAIRLLTAVFSLLFASGLFLTFGFTLPVFFIYIFVFTLLMYRFDTVIAIVLNVVLVVHLLTLGEVSIFILINEFGLMFLGVSVALVMNLFIIDIEDELIGYQKGVEKLMDQIFKDMGRCLINQCGSQSISENLINLDALLNKSRSRAFQYYNNYYFQENDYYVEYFAMRRQQYYTIRSMQHFITLKFLNKPEVEMLKDFTDDFVNNTKVLNTCSHQLDRLNQIKHHFTHEAELPTNNNHLQNRIALHQYLFSLEELVSIKMRFINRFENSKLRG